MRECKNSCSWDGGECKAKGGASCFSSKVNQDDECDSTNTGAPDNGRPIEDCRAACLKNSDCTGIQYDASDKNCDLIVVNCDFFKEYETDSPGEWKVESRTCFDGKADGVKTTPPKTTKPTGVKYVVQSPGKNSCSQGTLVNTRTGCMQAARHVNGCLTGRSTRPQSFSSPAWPKGCSTNDYGTWYFNTHSTGKGNSQASPVCLVGGPKPTKPKCPKNMINPFACKCGTEKTTTDAGCPKLQCKKC